ncbi:(deoxy)nucleoside triphosphate pyrophosphohydrolase [Pontibacter sp. BT310]|uniref:8-oxo-dGTP diphosphatase n=1 Tax=Pontibacter populi TaxID=890055 RepID=A0ABS6XIA2_9BACT|nr:MULTISPECIES: (deoxy)nucleoside triphosphate pyrophosphohydrolase [Pontibacter]MBJ6120053.1 (deoxy)nucleoside triphosphate pyrophosphohydrolase [Pontibacter sp. BT310]MBR0572482.1 (deoxy)nucleoside triphosphate pyrophosphohydrolase [Microvirga sp. STS03]MBW3366906.1 (deoxy)nucleoside triphosphate pyrophosphohydrolase [Pontibacter populi]
MIKVVCAIIENEGTVLITQRSSRMAQPLLWEFPGGKVEVGESEVEALIREIQEELNLLIVPRERLTPVLHYYSSRAIELIPYTCSLQNGNILLAEHQAYSWASLDVLANYSWCPADIPIVEEYLHLKRSQL